MRNVIIKACANNEQLSEKLFQSGHDTCWTNIEEATTATRNCSLLFTDLDDEKLHDLLLMGVNAISDITAALMSIRQGFYHPAALILRPVVENLACIAVFNMKKDAYDAFKAGNYQKPKAIDPAKEYFAGFGHLYGMLTQKFTHDPAEALARGVAEFGGSQGYSWVPPIDGTGRIPCMIGMQVIALAASISGEMLEWVFGGHLSTLLFWERIDDGQLKAKTTPGKRKMLALAEELKTALEEKKKESASNHGK